MKKLILAVLLALLSGQPSFAVCPISDGSPIFLSSQNRILIESSDISPPTLHAFQGSSQSILLNRDLFSQEDGISFGIADRRIQDGNVYVNMRIGIVQDRSGELQICAEAQGFDPSLQPETFLEGTLGIHLGLPPQIPQPDPDSIFSKSITEFLYMEQPIGLIFYWDNITRLSLLDVSTGETQELVLDSPILLERDQNYVPLILQLQGKADGSEGAGGGCSLSFRSTPSGGMMWLLGCFLLIFPCGIYHRARTLIPAQCGTDH